MSGYRLGLSLIKVGDRRREDYGDIDSLAASMSEHGLIHPIVVDAHDNLVAGGRRLRAAELLGWESIPATRLGDLTPEQLREIELEENLRRKDLTPIEASRTMVELAETVADLRSDAERKSNGGRPKDPSSLRSVAEEIGVSPGTILAAREHVAAVAEYPELESLPQAEAIRKARAISRPLDPDVMEKQQRDTAVENISRAVFTLEGNADDVSGKVAWILETRDLGALTPSRFERAATYCAAFADELRKRGITDGQD